METVLLVMLFHGDGHETNPSMVGCLLPFFDSAWIEPSLPPGCLRQIGLFDHGGRVHWLRSSGERGRAELQI